MRISTLLVAFLLSCQTPELHVAIVPSLVVDGGPTTINGCPTHCYDGTEAGLLANCTVGNAVCKEVLNGQEIVGCIGEQFLVDGGCGPVMDCTVATSPSGAEVIACVEE